MVSNLQKLKNFKNRKESIKYPKNYNKLLPNISIKYHKYPITIKYLKNSKSNSSPNKIENIEQPQDNPKESWKTPQN